MSGWFVDPVADTITFNVAPENGATIKVEEFPTLSTGGATDLWAFSAWSPLFGWPSEVEFFSGRLLFAATKAQPQTIWMSRTQDFSNFGRSVPTLDDDAVTFTIAARLLNKVKELVPLESLLPMTTGGEWRMTTGADEAVTPSTVGFKPQSYYGISSLPSLVIGNSALFVQDKGNKVRDIAFSFTDDGFTGNDLTVFADHLTERNRLTSIGYQKTPYAAVWFSRDDGQALSMTYVREQQVVGWARHTTQGFIENITTIPEGPDYSVYAIVRRFVGGQWKRYVERLGKRATKDVRDAFHVDSGLTFDGRNNSEVTMMPTNGGLFIQSSAPMFKIPPDQSDVGDHIVLRRTVTTIVGGLPSVQEFVSRYRIIAPSATTAVEVEHIGDINAVPGALEFLDVQTTNWEIARDTISGLGHMEGLEVSVLNDGNVERTKVVQGGSITLDRPGAVVHVGLPYVAIGESLDLNAPGSETIRDRPKLIRKVTLQVRDSRALKAGPDLNTLEEVKLRENEPYTDATTMATTAFEVQTAGEWDRNGRFVFLQDNPLPATVLSLTPDVALGGSS